MVAVMNFKRMEVVGANKAEALEKAPFGIQGDATQAYKLAKSKAVNGWTDADEKQFMLDYLAKKSKNLPGVGFSITVENAVADTRERPYYIKDVKNEEGTRKYRTTYSIFENLGTDEKPVAGKLLKEINTVTVEKENEAGKVEKVEKAATKADSKNLGKSLWTDADYKGKVVCYYTKQVVGGQPIAWVGGYAPSKGSHNGTWLVFGIENI